MKRDDDRLIRDRGRGRNRPGDIDPDTAFAARLLRAPRPFEPTPGMRRRVWSKVTEPRRPLFALALRPTVALLLLLGSVAAVRQFGVVNVVDVPQKFTDTLTVTWYSYGRDDSDASYRIQAWRTSGTVVDFVIDGVHYDGIELALISEPIIRQLAGSLLVAQKLGVSAETLRRVMPTLQPAAGRMGLFEGVNGSTIIDDTANFSPVAGVAGVQTLKRLPAKRHIGVIGNMHELGEFAEQGYAEVAAEFAGLDILVLVGDLSPKIFGEHAIKAGFVKDKNLFVFDNSPEAGAFMRDSVLRAGDAVFVKGPFGGFYLEEATKKMLNNPDDARYLTRQSAFWDHKKRQHFGAVLDA